MQTSWRWIFIKNAAASAAEQKAICEFTCARELVFGGHYDGPLIIKGSFRVLPEEWNSPLKINDELESYVRATVKNRCESSSELNSYYQDANPFCRLEPTYRDVSTFTDAKTGVELIVPGADSEFLMGNCPNTHMNACHFHKAREACQQLGKKLHKTLDLPTLRMVKTTGLMKRFKSSDAAKTMAKQEFWLSDRSPIVTDQDWRYVYFLNTMNADDLPTDDERDLAFALVCAVQK